MLRFRQVEEPSGKIRSGSPQRGFLIHVIVSSFTTPAGIGLAQYQRKRPRNANR
ncbi:hypothetical protein DAPPUDRAFT_241034 [Daphnia pulex]|uniref:Uncharacterized protein n=1 Tax=Daphnia pulex TaxID=6669 RepID=E9GD88_DAPPU|nr:hypothetical protein DAPPUDRAFT_241034 [Daphnia pulex]|eukprot:EFX82693.1 hypothetical protein DAPPUDRAFT_241034 [Daphnia pulex]